MVMQEPKIEGKKNQINVSINSETDTPTSTANE